MDHTAFMDQALGLAERGRGWVSPNPMVGAVVVRDGAIVGRGWHQEFGGPHAEVFALREAGDAARGATLYCTLEPCNHTGKTPPCVQAVLAAGVKTVVLGARDPNPAAAGGVEALKAAGVEVVPGVREDECRRLNAAFFKAVRTGLPLVSLKWAMSADGKLAATGGDSKWITGPAARARAHLLRAEHDAVLVGINTLLADGARLNCRIDPLCISPLSRGREPNRVRQPRRAILDSSARTPIDAPLWSADGGPVIVFCAETAPAARRQALERAGAEVVALATTQDRLPVQQVLTALRERGVLSVLVEGGSAVLGSFVDGGWADRAYVFLAPRIIGGRAAVTPIGGRGVSKAAEGLAMTSCRLEQIGPDVLVAGELGAWEWLGASPGVQNCFLAPGFSQ